MPLDFEFYWFRIYIFSHNDSKTTIFNCIHVITKYVEVSHARE